MTTWQDAGHTAAAEVAFDLPAVPFTLHRAIDPAPFVPKKESDRVARCETILGLQAAGLEQRLSGAHASTAVVGVSGGLDSTLALLVCARAFDDRWACRAPGFRPSPCRASAPTGAHKVERAEAGRAARRHASARSPIG